MTSSAGAAAWQDRRRASTCSGSTRSQATGKVGPQHRDSIQSEINYFYRDTISARTLSPELIMAYADEAESALDAYSIFKCDRVGTEVRILRGGPVAGRDASVFWPELTLARTRSDWLIELKRVDDHRGGVRLELPHRAYEKLEKRRWNPRLTMMWICMSIDTVSAS